MTTDPSREQRIARATALAESLGRDLGVFVDQVENGPFARGAREGDLPIEALRFFVEQTYHLVMNDMGNLSIYVARARNDEEREFFLFMTIAEKLMLDSLYLLIDAIGIGRDELAASSPNLRTAYRTNYFSRLALYHLPGEIALAILLNFPVWAAGARSISHGLKEHYGLGKPVPDTDLIDVDVLDRFTQATQGFQNMSLSIVAADLIGDEAEGRMRQVARLAVEYEAMVWQSYYDEGLKRAPS